MCSRPCEIQQISSTWASPPSTLQLSWASHLLSVQVAEEDDWAAIVGRYALELAVHRVKTFLWHGEQYPGKLALLLSDKPSEVQQCLDHLRKTWEAFVAAESRKETYPTVDKSCAEPTGNTQL